MVPGYSRKNKNEESAIKVFFWLFFWLGLAIGILEGLQWLITQML